MNSVDRDIVVPARHAFRSFVSHPCVMEPHAIDKSAQRRALRAMLGSMSPATRHARSLVATSLLAATQEFELARVVMLFLSTSHEIDTTTLALRCWQAGKTVAVPKLSWDQRRMMPVEINGLSDDQLTTVGPGIREPRQGNPIPVDMIDLVIVPALGFSPDGHRLGRGMGFYDRFLGQSGFIGRSCGFAFEDQVLPDLATQEHDVPVMMLVTDRQVRRFRATVVNSH